MKTSFGPGGEIRSTGVMKTSFAENRLVEAMVVVVVVTWLRVMMLMAMMVVLMLMVR